MADVDSYHERAEKAAHTVGPWHVGAHGTIEGANKEYIGLLTNRVEYFANACLVEAAPDLLAALEAILAWNRDIAAILPPAHFKLAAEAWAKATGTQ
jgi:hypothetical protein